MFDSMSTRRRDGASYYSGKKWKARRSALMPFFFLLLHSPVFTNGSLQPEWFQDCKREKEWQHSVSGSVTGTAEHAHPSTPSDRVVIGAQKD